MNKKDLTIFKSFEGICRKTPSAPFLVSPSRDQKGMTTFSYQETFEKAIKISTIFLDNGYALQSLFAILSEDFTNYEHKLFLSPFRFNSTMFSLPRSPAAFLPLLTLSKGEASL